MNPQQQAYANAITEGNGLVLVKPSIMEALNNGMNPQAVNLIQAQVQEVRAMQPNNDDGKMARRRLITQLEMLIPQ